MKKNDKDIELLSAYFDGELSPEEAKELEEKLSYTPELRNKLAEIKKLNEFNRSSIKKLPEAPYFETKLFAYLDEKPYKLKIKKWSPIAGIALLTLALMLLLKFDPDFIENVFEEQKSNLDGLYKENLKPLLFAADLSNEDIFNFAFYNQLPLDNNRKQFLTLGSDDSGNEYFEINTSGVTNEENNFENFINTLDLDENQKDQFDSIMSSYAEALQSQVLVNDKNTVAISPNIWNYQKAIVADILTFAKANNEEVVSAVMPVLDRVKSPIMANVVKKVKTAGDNEYIFFTPDSLFIDTFEFDADKFRYEMETAKREMKRSMQEVRNSQQEMNDLNFVRLRLDSSLSNLKRAPHIDKNFNIFIDSNICRIHVDRIEIPDIELPDMDSLEAIINEATSQLKSFAFSMPGFEGNNKTGKKSFKFHYEINSGDSVEPFDFDIPIPDVDSIIQDQMKNFQNFNFNAPVPNDSIMKWFNYFKYNDSTFTDNPRHFEFKMKEFEKEMEKFKDEMEKLKKEIRRDSTKAKIKKPVEI